MTLDLYKDPLGKDSNGSPVFLKDIWPTPQEIRETIQTSLQSDMFKKQYAEVFEGDKTWKELPVPEGMLFAWDAKSTYVREAPYFIDLPRQPKATQDIKGARTLALLGDSITTDHISPAGSIVVQP